MVWGSYGTMMGNTIRGNLNMGSLTGKGAPSINQWDNPTRENGEMVGDRVKVYSSKMTLDIKDNSKAIRLLAWVLF